MQVYIGKYLVLILFCCNKFFTIIVFSLDVLPLLVLYVSFSGKVMSASVGYIQDFTYSSRKYDPALRGVR